MSSIKSFRDLQVWCRAHELVLLLYKITINFPKNEIYALVSQMRRAAVSVASNIVEGFKRRSVKDSLNFYNTADASLEELRYQSLVARDLGYILEIEYEQLIKLEEEVSKMLYSWIKSQKSNST